MRTELKARVEAISVQNEREKCHYKPENTDYCMAACIELETCTGWR